MQDPDPDPLVYASRTVENRGPWQGILRAADPASVSTAVGKLVRAVFPGARAPRLRTVDTVLDDALLPQRIGSVLVGAMGLGALLLASVGLYGLVHYTVTRDTHELGVRLALGGGRGDLLRIVLAKGFRLVAIGVGVALLVAPALGPFLGEVSPFDPVTYGLVVACFAVVAAAASWLPARRTQTIDPAEALRGGG